MGPGRKARYCSSVCRRLGEYELRRRLRALERADVDVETWDRNARGLGWYGDAKHAAKQLAEAQRHRAECATALDEAVRKSERGESNDGR
jgi:hypothetical protein